MESYVIDINCDMGEGIYNEAELLPHISSCSIACGGHAGDAQTIRRVAILANQNRVKVGAHPSYPDKKNFGRKEMDLSNAGLKKSIAGQLELFLRILLEEKIRMHHIKPHGALYNVIAKNRALAITFLEAIEVYRAEAILFVPPNSQIAREADRRGFRLKYEAFADRNYNDDLSLVSRESPNAVLTDPNSVFEHLLAIVKNASVKTVSGNWKTLKADTFCIHGDTPNALQILTYLSKKLPKSDIQLRK